MKRIVLGFFLTVFLFSISSFVFAQRPCPVCPETGGLVPCGRSCDDPTTSESECDPCTLCHFFIMLDNWIDRLLFLVVPPLAALMIAIGGGMYILSAGKPEMISRAKQLFTAVAIGLFIIYGAWVIINTFLIVIGAAQWSGFGQDWWIVNCP